MTVERYFGSWTVTYKVPGKVKVREFKCLPGWTKAEAIKSALRYLAGFDITIVDAWKEQYQMKLPM